jgi:hypothetical protein
VFVGDTFGEDDDGQSYDNFEDDGHVEEDRKTKGSSNNKMVGKKKKRNIEYEYEKDEDEKLLQ